MSKALEKHARAIVDQLTDHHPGCAHPVVGPITLDRMALACLRVELEAEPTEAEVEALWADLRLRGWVVTREDLRLALKAARTARLREITKQGGW